MKLKKKQPIFTKQSFLQDSATEACFMVGYNLAKNHKPFSDREFFQDYSAAYTLNQGRSKRTAGLCGQRI